MDNLISFITQYGIFAMIIMVFLEYACFPVSSEIVLPLTGAAAAAAGMGYLPVTIVCSIAGLAGTYLIYSVSRYAGEKLAAKGEESEKDNKKKLEWCMSMIEKRGKYAVCISRVIPLFRTYIAFAAGLAGMSSTDYLMWSFLGIAVWNSILIACGYVLGSNWSRVGIYYQSYKYVILVTLILAVLILVAVKLLKRNTRKGGY